MIKTHYRTCNLCEAMCGLEIEYEHNHVISIKGDKEDQFSQGYICPKAVALQDIYEDPDRLRKPLMKTDSGWKEISWGDAFDEVASQLKSIQSKYGNDAVGIYQGNPNVHNLGAMLFGSTFARSIRTKNKFSATSADQLPHHFVSQFMLGHLLLLPVPDIDRTDYFLVFGANPLVSNGSMMSAAGMPKRLKQLKARGGKLVVIDPRKSETAQIADQHLFIQPGKDVYLLAGIVNLLLQRDPELPDYYRSLEQLSAVFSRFTPDLVHNLTGIDQNVIKKIVVDFCKADSAVCYGRMGVSTQQHGTLCQYLIYLINMLSGNFDKPGGFMVPTPAIDVVKATGPKGTIKKFNRWKSRVKGLPEFGGELPVVTMAEEILTSGDGQIKAMITNAGNPILSTPNGVQLDKAFSSLDFMVSIDIYLNETTRHADIILPPATGLEVEHYDLVFNNLAVRNIAKFSDRLFSPADGSLEDWQIFKELASRFKKQSLKDRILSFFMKPQKMLDYSLKRGPYKGLTLSKLKKLKHGIDLGPLQPSFPERLFTEDKKIDLAPTILIESLKQLETAKGISKDLLLIGRRQLRSNNSWMHNSQRLVKGGDRCTLFINEKDAKDRRIEDGSKVTVSSRVGRVDLKAKVTNEMGQGVVSVPHGWGHNRTNTKWAVAEANAGVSLNDLTDEMMIDHISGNAAFNGVPVDVMPAN